MKVIGYLRFSYFGLSDVRMSHAADQEAYRAALFHPTRMEARFQLFESLCLPSLKAQVDKNFELILLASPSMPDVYKERLHALVGKLSFVHVVYSDAPKANQPFNEKAVELLNDTDEMSVHFRLDDDDAMGKDAVRSFRKMARQLNRRTVLSLATGLALFQSEGETYLLPKYSPFIGLGFALANPPGFIQNPYECSHRRVSMRLPSMVDPGPTSYIHCMHPAQDSASRKVTSNASLLSEMSAEKLEANRAEASEKLAFAFPWITEDRLAEVMTQTAPETKKAG